MKDWIYTQLLYLLPQHLLSLLMYRLTRIRHSGWKNWQMRWFINRYHVDMSEAVESDPLQYRYFNEFFTRKLKTDARPLSKTPGSLISPADGAISQAGRIHGDRILQAKQHNYSLAALLGGDESLAAHFLDGLFATIYLSPRDYHRVHMPCDGELQQMVYVPGKLFSVNKYTADHVPGLFARNERVISIFRTDHGPIALILVGAFNVGSMETVWHGMVTPPYGHQLTRWDYQNQSIALARGEEMGRFNMGSTVIVLLPAQAGGYQTCLQSAQGIRMGQDLFVNNQ